jgi:dethiobiotin synthetase
MKPIAAGCTDSADGLRNDDAERIRAQASRQRPYAEVNPYAFAPPIAPHIAAQQSGAAIELGRIQRAYQSLAANADWVLVEGAGGWRVPLGPDLTLADLPKTLELPVLLVVGLRLGCLNHALLSAESILASGLPLRGWVANQVDPDMAAADANLDTLRQRLPAPCIGVVPWLNEPMPDHVAEHLDISALD